MFGNLLVLSRDRDLSNKRPALPVARLELIISKNQANYQQYRDLKYEPC